jgi:hypothetical protein
MEGVKIIKPVPALEDEQASDDLERKGRTEERPSEPTTRANSAVRGTDAGTVTAREGTDTERAESFVTGESLATGTATAKETTYSNLGEEITSVVRRFPRVNFEKVSLLPCRLLIVLALISSWSLGSRRRSLVHRLSVLSTIPSRHL